ncbi:hypothetical protein TWF506_004445 [Arthrobotrys conoides]|uniref:Uncharacterized protein n=1 Tax=Arthrobotrys conoides TaxID=74498 RepID=A0AAN8RTJ3_9PEZI
MCYHYEQLYTCGHTKRERRVTCDTPKQCRMNGQPGILQVSVPRSCGTKECKAAETYDQEEEEEPDEDEGDKSGKVKGGGRFRIKYAKKKSVHVSKVTTRSKWNAQHPPALLKNQEQEQQSLVQKVVALGPPEDQPKANDHTEQNNDAVKQKAARNKATEAKEEVSLATIDSDSSLSSAPSDEENPFEDGYPLEDLLPSEGPLPSGDPLSLRDPFLPEGPFPTRDSLPPGDSYFFPPRDPTPHQDPAPPKIPLSAPKSTSIRISSRRAKVLQEQFQGLKIIESNSPTTGKKHAASGDIKSPEVSKSLKLLPPSFRNGSSKKRSIQSFMSDEVDSADSADNDGAMEIDSPQGAPAQRKVSEPVLKSAIRTTDYEYVRPGRVTRSISAAQLKQRQLRDQRKSLPNKTSARKSESSSPHPARDDERPAAKRVRFAPGSKETSNHMVLEPPDDVKEKPNKEIPEDDEEEEQK